MNRSGVLDSSLLDGTGFSDRKALYLTPFKRESNFSNYAWAAIFGCDIAVPLVDEKPVLGIVADSYRDHCSRSTTSLYREFVSTWCDSFSDLENLSGISVQKGSRWVEGHIEDYELIVVPIVWFMLPLLVPIAKAGEHLVIGLHDDSFAEISSAPYPLAKLYRDCLSSLAAYITYNEQMLQFARSLNPRTIIVPHPLPEGLAASCDKYSFCSKRVCVGIGSQSTDLANVMSSAMFAKRHRGSCDVSLTYEFLGAGRNIDVLQQEWDGLLTFIPRLDTESYHQALGEFQHVVSFTERACAGRPAVDAVLAGIPYIGTRLSGFQSMIFPELAIDHWDVSLALDLSQRLLRDSGFYKGIMLQAASRLQAIIEGQYEMIKQSLVAMEGI